MTRSTYEYVPIYACYAEWPSLLAEGVYGYGMEPGWFIFQPRCQANKQNNYS